MHSNVGSRMVTYSLHQPLQMILEPKLGGCMQNANGYGWFLDTQGLYGIVS